MAWNTLKEVLDTIFTDNGNNEITGPLTNQATTAIVEAVGENATFVGAATPSTAPGIPDGPVFYISQRPGIYGNFNGYVSYGGLTVHYWDTATWTNTKVNSTEEMTQLYKQINSNWTYKGKVKTGMSAPPSIVGDLYVPIDNGAMFSVTVEDFNTQVLVSDGTSFKVFDLEEYRTAIKSLFSDTDILLSKFIALNTGVISNGGAAYKTVKVYLEAGEYWIDTPGSVTQDTLWKYTDSTYATPESQILGNVADKYSNSVTVTDSGYYAFSCSYSNDNIHKQNSNRNFVLSLFHPST